MNAEMFRPSPYQGLAPFLEKDSLFFFGREVLRDNIISSLISSRLTVIYGASGVGKSSVVHAGVAHKLKHLARTDPYENGTPAFVTTVFSEWHGDPIKELTGRVRRSISNDLEIELSPPAPSLAESLQVWAGELRQSNLTTELIIILDQFEDYFLYHNGGKSEGAFVYEFLHVVDSADLTVNFLISIRDDAYAKLDCFEDELSNLFVDSIRITHLTREEARAAIKGPIERYNSFYAAGRKRIFIEPELVEAVLDQVQTDKIFLGDAGGGVAKAIDLSSREAGIETPFLQLVMNRLWELERASDSNTVRLSTLNSLAEGKLNGAQSIARKHLLSAMNRLSEDEKDIASRIFYRLVTPSRTKIACTNYDLVESEHLDQAQLKPVLENLLAEDNRILSVSLPPDKKSEPRYEIFHDVLVPAILEWRRQHVIQQKERQAARRIEEQARIARKRLFLIIFLMSAVLLMGIATAWALIERSRAKEARRKTDIANITNNNIGTELYGRIPKEHLPQLLKNLQNEFKDNREEPDPLRYGVFNLNMAAVSRMIGYKLVEDGEYAKALDYYGKAEEYTKEGLESFKVVFDEGSSYRAIALNELGVIYYAQGRFSEVEQPLTTALEIMEKLLERDDFNLLPYIDNLAEYSRLLGRYERAERLYKKALDIRRERWPSEPLQVAVGLKNLANVYVNQEKYDEAKSGYDDALAIVEQTLGKDSPHVAEYLKGQAYIYREWKMFSESERLLLRALELDTAASGKESVAVAYDNRHLGRLYSESGNYKDAEKFLNAALKKLENAIGVRKVIEADIRRMLAITYYKQGKYNEAKPLFEDALAIEEKTLGPDSLDVAKTLESYADLLDATERTPKAKEMRDRAKAIRDKLKGS